MAVFYRTYRPQRLSDLIGQETIAKILLSQLETGKFGHGYLFYGPKGTGKTSTARILAKAVNCIAYNKKQETRNRKQELGEPCNRCISCLSVLNGSHLDLIEIDAASNRGIDEIRDLREKIKLSPVSGRFKLYIIDEVHMLTPEAFNALLKTLEEPPAHAIFILCTTEVGKLPQTIVSRLQRFNFSRAKTDDLVKVVEKIAKLENIKIEKDAVSEIAQIADGSYRDAISVFDQLAAKTKLIKFVDVSQIAKIGGWNQLYKFIEYLADGKLKEAIVLVEKMVSEGADVSFFAKQAILFLERLLFLKIGVLDDLTDDLNRDQVEKMQHLAGKFESDQLQYLMKLFLVAESEIKLYPLPQIPIVLAVCKFVPEESKDIEVIEGIEGSEGSKGSKDIEVSKVSGGGKGIKKDRSLSKGNPGKKSNTSLQQIEENWDKFLNKVKPINAHVVALLRATRPVDFDGSNLTMEVFYRFHKERLEEPKVIRMLDEAMEDVINRGVKLRFILADKEARVPRVVAKSDVVEIKEGDLEKIAQEVFSK